MRESSEILRKTQKNWETMGTDTVREWVGFEKIKRIETEAKQNKA